MGHLVAVFDEIFKAADLGARLTPYEIMATSPTAGVIEVNASFGGGGQPLCTRCASEATGSGPLQFFRRQSICALERDTPKATGSDSGPGPATDISRPVRLRGNGGERDRCSSVNAVSDA